MCVTDDRCSVAGIYRPETGEDSVSLSDLVAEIDVLYIICIHILYVLL